MRETLAKGLRDRLLLITRRLGDVQPQHDHMGQIAADLGQHLFDIV